MINLGSGVNKWIMIFIVAIVGFALVAELYPVASDAGDELNASNMCSEASCFYNSTRTIDCTANNASGADTTICTTGYGAQGLPLSTLFASGGVVFLIIMAGFLFVYLKRK